MDRSCEGKDMLQESFQKGTRVKEVRGGSPGEVVTEPRMINRN